MHNQVATSSDGLNANDKLLLIANSYARGYTFLRMIDSEFVVCLELVVTCSVTKLIIRQKNDLHTRRLAQYGRNENHRYGVRCINFLNQIFVDSLQMIQKYINFWTQLKHRRSERFDPESMPRPLGVTVNRQYNIQISESKQSVACMYLFRDVIQTKVNGCQKYIQ